MASNLNSNKLNVSFIKLCTEVEGPFKRCCIWFQGCNVKCADCCNKDLQELKPAHILSIAELVEIVQKSQKEFDIEGITLSGGEPSLQKYLIAFNNEIHKLGLGIIMFSGHYKEDLPAGLVESVDLLIAGPYDKNQPDHERILLGSKNKQLCFISDRYKPYESYFYNPISVEEVSVDGKIFINGD